MASLIREPRLAPGFSSRDGRRVLFIAAGRGDLVAVTAGYYELRSTSRGGGLVEGGLHGRMVCGLRAHNHVFIAVCEEVEALTWANRSTQLELSQLGRPHGEALTGGTGALNKGSSGLIDPPGVPSPALGRDGDILINRILL